MRTAVALMGFGVVILRLRYLSPHIPRTGMGWKLGLMFALVGLLTVLLSTFHYFSVCEAIDEENYEPARWWIVLFSFCIALIGSGVIYFLLTSPIGLTTAMD